jgi:excisionase family DNA binding protein
VEPALLSVGQVARMFRVDPKTVSRWGESGALAAFRTPGGHWRFQPAAVREFLPEPVELLTTPEVAALFGVDRMTATRWAVEGVLPVIRTPGGHWRFLAQPVRDRIAGRPASDESSSQKTGEPRPIPAVVALDPKSQPSD